MAHGPALSAQPRKSARELTGISAVLFGPLILTTFFAKLGTPVGPREVPASVYLMIVLLGLGLFTSRLRFDLPRLGAFAIMVIVLGAVPLLRGKPWSVTSFLMMCSLYATYTVTINSPRLDVRVALDFFLKVSVVIAILGIVQFLIQFVIGWRLAFALDVYTPKLLIVEGFMNLREMSYNSGIYKPNGVFLLEASFYSQLLAMAVLAELLTTNKLWRLGVFGVGLLLSYSGTGIIILAFTLPFLVIVERRVDMLLLALGALMVALVFHEQLNLDLFLDRATEFTSKKSSGFERFVGAFYLFEQFLWADQLRTLFGFGPGAFREYMERANVPVHEGTYAKLIFEFGLIGFAVNIGFLMFCVIRSSAPGILKLGVTVMFFMAGVYTPSAHGIALSVLMWPAPVPEPIKATRRGGSMLRWLGLDFDKVRRPALARAARAESEKKRRLALAGPDGRPARLLPSANKP